MSRVEYIQLFLDKNPQLKSFFSPATVLPMYEGVDVVKMRYKVEGEEDGSVMLVIVMLTRGKTVARSSPTVGMVGSMFVERWISRAEEGLYASPFELDEVFGPVERFEEERWMKAAMNCEEWLYREFRCRKRCL